MNPLFKCLLVCTFTTLSVDANAGINYSRYDDAPEFFFGWETSLYFAIAAIILFFISYNLTKHSTDEQGINHGDCILGWINVAMIICAICSAYLLIPLYIIYIIIKSFKKH